MTGEIIVSGQPVMVNAEVRTWHKTSLGFPALGKRAVTRAVGLHWTAGEGGGTQVHRTLQLRGLSVHFLVDQAGVIWQYADATDRCAHMSEANGYAVGIEISNRANGVGDHVRYPRDVYQEMVHGKSFKCTSFYPEQTDAVKSLTQALCRVYGIPYQAPPADTVLAPAELKTWRGVLGHFHTSRRKTDPGTQLLVNMGLR